MVSEILIICGTIGLLMNSILFGGGMIMLGIIGATLRYAVNHLSELIQL